jgi:hypothetical protein
MPVERCSDGGKPGFRFGDSGKCYTYTQGDQAGMRSARDKARAQERAAYASGFTGKSYDDTEYDFLNEFLLKEEVSTYEEFLEDVIKEAEYEIVLPPDDQEEEGHEHMMLDRLDAEERMFANALLAITQKYGKFNADDEGVWVGFETGEDNEDAEIGVKCSNCVFAHSEKVCMIIEQEIEPNGKCRLAVIPKGLVQPDMDDEDDEDEDDEEMDKVTYGRPGPNDPRKTPAKPSERRRGSSRNRSGSAEGGSSVTFSDAVTRSLKTKMDTHNDKHGDAASKRATMAALKAVYRRGAGAFSTSHRPGMTRGQWAMARVNAYLYLLRNGRPSNPNYNTDNDLLPKGHPRSSKK